jgi:hypothetical protein
MEPVNHALPLELEEPTPGDDRTIKPIAGGHDYSSSSVQEVSLAGCWRYQLHLLFDKHHSEQSELIDSIAERVRAHGGVSLAIVS